MDVAGLPINVQRRIALLLDQDTAARATPSTSFSLPDPPVVDQAAPAVPYRIRPEAGNHDTIWTWNFPLHALALQLHQQPAVAVNRAALGPSKLQARACLQPQAALMLNCTHPPLCLQACRSEAEHVVQNASSAGLGGGLQLQTYHNLQVCAYLANLKLIDIQGYGVAWLATLKLTSNVISCAFSFSCNMEGSAHCQNGCRLGVTKLFG